MPGKSGPSKSRRKQKTEHKQVLMTKQSRITTPQLSESAEPEIVQEHPEDAPAGWRAVQNKLAANSGLALLLVEGPQPPAIVASNNNSICHAFQSSIEYVALCDPYCGDAHRRAMSAGTAVQYKCHAGLQCFTMPVQISNRQNLAVIGGRAFVSGADYRALVERFRAGELNHLLAKDPFGNVIFAEPERLEQLAERLDKAARHFSAEMVPSPKTEVQAPKSKGQSPVASEVAIKAGVVTVGEANPSATGVPTAQATPVAQVALQNEVDRLRVELEYRSQLADSLRKFLERISSTDPAKTYQAILKHVSELLQAERASLWGLDKAADEMILRASVGFSLGEESRRISTGQGIGGKVLESGRPLAVEDLEAAGLTAAPADRNYKTKSFVSYPIGIGGRTIGLINLTDKLGGKTFNDVDLSLLEIVGPQIAIALERSEWQERATQFQLMSITDPLTGLLNRRYLEERLAEELSRSNRYNYSMSCLMIDIDDFKNYNDRNGHQAGDVALKITAHSLKAALRSADIACRYGGEEFCILLPQTTVTEAGVIAERMRQKVAETVYPHGRSQPEGRVSISIGVSTLAKHIDTAESVIAAADRALYKAKSNGKNRIEFYVDNLTSASSGK